MSGAAATTNPSYTTAYADNNGTSFTEGASDGVLNGTSAVTVVSAPASSTRRIVNTITVENNDTAVVTITVGYVNGANTRVIAKVTLQVGDTWTTTGAYDTNGNLKQIMANVNLATQVTGTLPIANGGTGATSLASASIATYTGSETLTNKTLTAPTITNALVTSIRETTTVSATAATGTINFDTLTQVVLYYTTNASGNFTVNFRGNSGTSLDTVMSTGQSLSATFLVTNGSTAYYNSAVTIDGNSVTPKWQGGSAPTSGNASAVDSYTYVIVKTGSATFTVLASQTKFA